MLVDVNVDARNRTVTAELTHTRVLAIQSRSWLNRPIQMPCLTTNQVVARKKRALWSNSSAWGRSTIVFNLDNDEPYWTVLIFGAGTRIIPCCSYEMHDTHDDSPRLCAFFGAATVFPSLPVSNLRFDVYVQLCRTSMSQLISRITSRRQFVSFCHEISWYFSYVQHCSRESQ